MKYDLAIIGGGPAGVAAGVYAARKGLKTLFITKDWESQSVVSEGIENWIGTVKIAGKDFAKSLEEHLRAYAAQAVDIKVGESVEKIEAGFKIKTNKAEYEAQTVLVTTGSMRKKLAVPGADVFEHKGLTYCASCDGPLFSGQDVVVVGGGNAGFESAAQLLAYCKSVTLLNRSDSFRADPVTIEKVSQNPNFKIIKNAQIQEVVGDKFVTGIKYNDTLLPVAAIFVEIGSVPTTYFAKGLVNMNENGNIIVDPRTQRASLEGVWAAGDCTDGLYHQNNIAAGDAVKALEDIYLYLKA